MNSSRLKIILVLFIIGGSSLSLLYWSFHSYNNINKSLQEFLKPNKKTNTINQVFQDIIEADNCFNTYILTAEKLMLEQYEQNMFEANSNIDLLKQGMSSENTQLLRLDSLQYIINQKSDYLKIILNLKKDQSSAFFTSEALYRIGKQLQDTAFIEKALLKREMLLATKDSIEKEEIIIHPDDYEGISGFFRKLFGKENIRIDTIRSLEEQIDYTLQVSVDTSIVRDYFIDTTLLAVKSILVEVLAEEIDMQTKLNQAELNLIRQDQRFIESIKNLIDDILEEERSNNLLQSEKTMNRATLATEQIFITGGLGILLSAIFLFLIFRDIAKANHYRKKLEIQKDKAEKLARVKEDFLAKMSHEIRTPLHNISGFTELLNKQKLNDKSTFYLKAIRQSNFYLNELIDNILEQSKIDSGNFILDKSDVFLPDVANEIQLVFQYKFLKKSLDFNLKLNPILSNYLLEVDLLKLKQVLINLVGNSLKFTDEGHVQLAFDLNIINNEQAELLICIEDTGVGISENDQEIIFQEFKQGVNSKISSLSGTGLGLSISKHIIESFGGNLSLESQVDHGTIFRISFITKYHDYQSSIIKEPSILETASETIFFPINILLVEDDEWNAKLLHEGLIDFVKNITIFSNAEDALEFLKSTNSIDLIFTDINLPGMSGSDFLRKLRNTGFKEPIVALTAQIQNPKHQTVLNIGFNDVCRKPFTNQDLIDIISKFFKGENQLGRTQLDLSFLEEFAGYDTDNFQDLFQDFKSGILEKISFFKKYVEEENYVQLEIYCHQLKSALEQIKFETLSEELEGVEVFISLNDFNRAKEKCLRLIPKLDDFVVQINEFKHQYYTH